ncbi:MAG: AraC family transcriptional regulator [Paludibacteraceae bacterium]|nr:AraC family transcriptional regulator [Paludibacteraceae bacterium]
MEEKMHPIWNHEYIQRQGVIVTEVDNLPTEEMPFQSDALVIGLCLSGSADFTYNMVQTTFVSQELGVTLPNALFTHSTVSPDYRSLLVIISKEFFDEFVHRSSFMDYKKYYYSPACHLSDVQFENIKAILRVLHIVSASDHPKRREGIENILDLLFYTITRYRGEEGVKSDTETRNEQLFSRFYDLLTDNYAAHHDIGWYADQLCLSPKYFSAVIRQTTDKSAAEWIDIVLVMRAKNLLRSRRDLAVQQVAFALGFSENASFCRFFKDQTGFRPSEYRNR